MRRTMLMAMLMLLMTLVDDADDDDDDDGKGRQPRYRWQGAVWQYAHVFNRFISVGDVSDA